jgi:hypothetical protein
VGVEIHAMGWSHLRQRRSRQGWGGASGRRQMQQICPRSRIRVVDARSPPIGEV